MSLNDDQIDYIRSLGKIPPSERCYCGWYRAGKCYHCKDRATLADRLKVQCPGCDNYPLLGGSIAVTHRIGCTSPDWQPDPSVLIAEDRG